VNDGRGISLSDDAVGRVPWCTTGRYLKERMPFTFDVDFQTGRYYVQDASSMFIHHVIKHVVKEPVRYLDLCAAPGGKTTTAISALPADSMVVANEIMPARARVLHENIVKWGSPRCIVTNNAPHDLGKLHHFFDVVATDVPCSGEGMMRKDEEARNQWSPALVKQCAALQKSIIADIWQALRPGGVLIYSTCTYNREENEEMVEHIVEQYGAESVEIPVEADWHIHPAIDSPYHCYRFMPHRTNGEGLFMAVLRKPDDERRAELRAKKSKGAKAKAIPVPRGVDAWLNSPKHYALSVANDEVVAIPADIAPLMPLFADLRVLQAGQSASTGISTWRDHWHRKGEKLCAKPCTRTLHSPFQRGICPKRGGLRHRHGVYAWRGDSADRRTTRLCAAHLPRQVHRLRQQPRQPCQQPLPQAMASAQHPHSHHPTGSSIKVNEPTGQRVLVRQVRPVRQVRRNR